MMKQQWKKTCELFCLPHVFRTSNSSNAQSNNSNLSHGQVVTEHIDHTMRKSRDIIRVSSGIWSFWTVLHLKCKFLMNYNPVTNLFVKEPSNGTVWGGTLSLHQWLLKTESFRTWWLFLSHSLLLFDYYFTHWWMCLACNSSQKHSRVLGLTWIRFENGRFTEQLPSIFERQPLVTDATSTPFSASVQRGRDCSDNKKTIRFQCE